MWVKTSFRVRNSASNNASNDAITATVTDAVTYIVTSPVTELLTIRDFTNIQQHNHRQDKDTAKDKYINTKTS
ncbi:MAG: hypothetical protein MJZ15_05150, partial [Bacteroidales bacterium]|nr:hypothetical protein [Bacteroidales bacterium]